MVISLVPNFDEQKNSLINTLNGQQHNQQPNWRIFSGNSSSNSNINTNNQLQQQQNGGQISFQKCLSWSADGEYLISSGTDKQISLYKFGKQGNGEKPFKEKVFQGHQETVDLVKYHPDKPNIFVSSSFDDKTIKLWDHKSSKFYQSIQLQSKIICINWSPSGKLLAAVDRSDVVHILDIPSLKVIAQQQLSDGVNDVLWSKDELSFYVVLDNGKIRSYSFPKFEAKSLITGHCDICVQIKPSKDYESFYVASLDSLITAWDFRSEHCYKVLSKFDNSIINFDISHNNMFIAASTEDNEIGIVTVDTNEKIQSFSTKLYPTSLQWNPKTNFLAYCTERTYEHPEPIIKFAGVHK